MPLWVAVDLVERPELRSTLADDATYVHVCVRCKLPFPREHALIATRLSHGAPVILGCGPSAIKHGDRTLGAAELIAHVTEQVRLTPAPIAWPIVAILAPALTEASRRDVDKDLADPRAAVESLAGRSGALAAAYGDFLQRVLATEPQRQLQLAAARLHRAVTEEQLRALIDDHPEVLDPAFAAILSAGVAETPDPDQRLFLAAEARLLERCRAAGDISGAWDEYKRTVEREWTVNAVSELRALAVEFDRVADDDPARGADLAEEIVVRAPRVGDVSGEAAAAAGGALCHLRVRDRRFPERVERAIKLLERAEMLYDEHPEIGDRQARREVQAHLAGALGERSRQDPAANQQRAIDIQERLLADLAEDDDTDLRAKTHTHLAGNMLSLALATDDREDGAVRDLSEILDHLHEALTWRSEDRNPLDWAYTQLLLGRAHAEGGGSRDAAIEHLGLAVRGFTHAGAHTMAARARANLVAAQLAEGYSDDVAAERRLAVGGEAVREARAALEVLTSGPGTVLDGGAWWQLARALMLTDPESPEIAQALRRTLEHWTAQTVPGHARDVARALAVVCEKAGDLAGAADAWDEAAQAAAAAMDLRSTREGRLAEARHDAGVYSAAAVRLASVGRLERAVEVIELGRARLLAAWIDQDLVDLEALRHADPGLHTKFVELRGDLEMLQSLRPDVADVRVAAAAERLDGLLEDIRSTPGLERFLLRPELTKMLADAPRDGPALAYPLISDTRCLWLIVRPHTVPPVQALDLPELSASDVRRALRRTDPDTGAEAGYLPAHRDTQLLRAEIPRVSDLLAPNLIAPLHEALVAEGVDEVCIIALGALGLMPLHALSWTSADHHTTLVDELLVTYAPSAYAYVVCHRRNRRSLARRGLAVGDPQPTSQRPLPMAHAEAALVADLLGSYPITLLRGRDATRNAVVDALDTATHVHLACHGLAAFTGDPFASALWFAEDAVLTAGDLVEIDIKARLFVASACQSAVIADLDAADEALALSNVIIAAGAAGVIASLWNASDYVTAVLMTRMYELMAQQVDLPPARALREASLWVRALTVADERAFLAAHATLAAARSDVHRERLANADDGERHLNCPTLWAAFTYSGA
jgi:CHAT domain-containing protein/tetratricopeptide (TPR) repeat protein